MLSFLSDLISRTPPEKLTQRLVHTAYDELMVIDLKSDRFEGRYHADGKFFTPVIDNHYSSLFEYSSSHMVHPEDREAHRALMNPADMEERLARAWPRGILSGVIRYVALDGNWREMETLLIGGTGYALPEHTVQFYLFDVRDMRSREEGMHTETTASTRRLRDMMPDLLSEAVFFTMAQEKMHNTETQWCMIAIDIKHFKLFKDLNGRVKGEQLLIRFAERIHEVAEQMDGLACYRGQDDYSLMIPFDQPVIDRLFSSLRHEIDTLSAASGFFPIFGIAMILDPDESAMDQFNHAALTAEEIKDDLQCHVRIYDPDVHERHVEEFKLLSDFQAALKNGEITFHIQPQVNVETGRIVGGEALTRWKRADGTFLSPNVFVPVLEKYGIITDLDTHLWEQVFSWLRHLTDSGIQPVPVSLNVSRMCIFSMDVPAAFSSLAEKYGVDPALVKVEITETAYVEDEGQIRAAVAELQSRGFLVMMDDFGSGYSSLGMLRTVNVDVIKLDAQFLRFSIGEEQKGIHILESIINMIKSLSIPLIVEGVDSPALVHYLKDVGCYYMQGFHFYRPMPSEQFEALIALPGNTDPHGIALMHHEQLHIREFLDSNIYSDAMLNNILGPVAFYARKDDNVDIVRFNSQFLHLITIGADVMEERRFGIQGFFYPDDRPKFFDMLTAAEKDPINGAEGLFRIYLPDGGIFWMHLRVYYLREENGRQLFYGSARDMTEIMVLRSRMSRLEKDSGN
jgi:EAL domain-containing protein (putative c-di-GMP-specific phosphodiesterase class I)/GGDEF domain-containing protein